MSEKDEEELVAKTCNYIRDMCKELKLRKSPTCTAYVFFHRFFARQSFLEYDRYVVAATCVFLASKVDEDSRRIKDVIHVANRIKNGDHESTEGTVLNVASQEFKDWKSKILAVERNLLHTMSFDVKVFHPHNTALRLLDQISAAPELKQIVWSLLNDTLRFEICLYFEEKLIAIAALLVAAKILRSRPTSMENIQTRKCLELVSEAENSKDVFGASPDVLLPVTNALSCMYDRVGYSRVAPLSQQSETSESDAKRQKTQ